MDITETKLFEFKVQGSREKPDLPAARHMDGVHSPRWLALPSSGMSVASRAFEGSKGKLSCSQPQGVEIANCTLTTPNSKLIFRGK